MMNYLIDLNTVPQEKPREIDIGSNGMSIDLLRAVYRSASIPLPVRLRAAIAALPHEVPRLQVSALVSEESFAEILERRLKKLDAMNGKPQQIDQTIEAKPPPLPRLADRRFRRV
jgi:hypothetical protein